jgi:hypothetical protein
MTRISHLVLNNNNQCFIEYNPQQMAVNLTSFSDDRHFCHMYMYIKLVYNHRQVSATLKKGDNQQCFYPQTDVAVSEHYNNPITV